MCALSAVCCVLFADSPSEQLKNSVIIFIIIIERHNQRRKKKKKEKEIIEKYEMALYRYSNGHNVKRSVNNKTKAKIVREDKLFHKVLLEKVSLI